MKRARKIIAIDEEKCTGCGQCVISCAEGALQIVGGKAKLVGEIYCDGFGACVGRCPEGALSIVEREAEEFDEAAVRELLRRRAQPAESLPCGCPGTGGEPGAAQPPSMLGHWPIKLQLLRPSMPFLQGAPLVLLADCAAVAFPDLHRKILRGNAIATGCPKLDDLHAHIRRLAEIIKGARPRSITVVHMEVPCCGGLAFAAKQAMLDGGAEIPLRRIIISIRGELLEEEAVYSDGRSEATGTARCSPHGC